MTVRQVAAEFPASQTVFRRYGEPERCRARFGHLEPLTHFARRHNVALDGLLAELATVTGTPVDSSSRFAERVHHGFILSALAITLTLGAGWGAWLLWRIGVQHDFGAVPVAHVVGHGEAQFWGFIALFIWGVSLRTILQPAVRYGLGAWACRGPLALALIGIAGSFAWSLWPEALSSLGAISAASLITMSMGYLQRGESTRSQIIAVACMLKKPSPNGEQLSENGR